MIEASLALFVASGLCLTFSVITARNQQVGRNEVAGVKAPAYLISQTVAVLVDLSLIYRNFASM